MSRQGVIWSTAAVLGIVCAAALAWAALQLAGQHIGLASEPLSVARSLAPRDRGPAEGTVRAHHRESHRVSKSATGQHTRAAQPASGPAVTSTTTAVSPAFVVPPVSSSSSPPPRTSAAAPQRTQMSTATVTSGSAVRPSDSSGAGNPQRDDNGGQQGGSGSHPDD